MAPRPDAERTGVHFYRSRERPTVVTARMFAWLVITATAAGCGSDTNSQGSSAQYPIGLATDSPSLSTTVGVYPGTTTRAAGWTATHVFYVPGDASATSVTIGVYVSAVGLLAMNPGSVSTVDPRRMAISTKALKNCVQTLSLSLPRASGLGGEVTVRLRMSTAFVPKDLGVNGDIRRLSVVLLSAKLSNPSS